MNCPCGLGQDYAGCCGRWHEGPLRLQAPDPERLMRSRYTAYVRGDLRYLMDTWASRTRPASLDLRPAGLQWLGLTILAADQADECHGEVEFVARFRRAGRATRIHEKSRFERLDGRWVYVDGDQLA